MKTPSQPPSILPDLPDWQIEANNRIEKIRKGDFTVTLTNPDGSPVANANISAALNRHHFQFGTAVAESLLTSQSADADNYRKFILENFNAIVCENAMKWYSTEAERGVEAWDLADAVVDFAKAHDLPLRGHCLFWDRPKFIQPWIQELTEPELQDAVERHGEVVVKRYQGKVTCWDVNNEMLDGSFFQDRLGPDVRASMFRRAREADADVPLFTNEFGILDSPEKTAQYCGLVRDLLRRGAPVTGIGVQEHAVERFVPAPPELMDENPERVGMGPLDPMEVWKRLDELSEFGLPIHLTEISAKTSDPIRRAASLEAMYRVGFAHPNVDLILLWGFWEKCHWLGSKAALIDATWNRLPAADRLSNLLHKEWTTKTSGQTAPDGTFTFRGFYGRYDIRLTDASGKEAEMSATLTPSQRTLTFPTSDR